MDEDNTIERDKGRVARLMAKLGRLGNTFGEFANNVELKLMIDVGETILKNKSYTAAQYSWIYNLESQLKARKRLYNRGDILAVQGETSRTKTLVLHLRSGNRDGSRGPRFCRKSMEEEFRNRGKDGMYIVQLFKY